MKYFLLVVLGLSLIPRSYSQDDEAGNFFIGVNVGGYFANKKTAIMYTGSSVAVRGISYYIPTTFGGVATYDLLNPDIRNYFSYDYKIEEDGFPSSPAYKPAIDVGVHAGVQLGGGNTVFLDVNSTTLKYEQFFSVTVEDPNGTPQIRYEQVPIFGEEKRLNINLGTQISLYYEDGLNWYASLFGNFNSARLQKNYFILNNKQYSIGHYTYGTANVLPGGNGFGGGAGTGVKYKFNDKFTFDLTYNLIYSKTTMNEDFHPFGINHSVLLRVIWG